ncbi:MAG: hypothetical protein Q9220_007215 [cf. Caloplaca sp. 1 TL-2023]
MGLRKLVRSCYTAVGAGICYIWTEFCDLLSYVFIELVVDFGYHSGLRIEQVTIFWWWFIAVVLVPCYPLPWIWLTGLYITQEGLCQWDITRGFLGAAVCWPDLVVPQDWPRSEWEAQKDRGDYLDALGPSIETLMIGHLMIHDTRIDLEQQGLKLRHLARDDPAAQEVLSELEAVVRTLNVFSHQWEVFSLVFCLQKDSINLAYRSLIEVYALALASDRGHVSLIFFPALQLLRDWNKAVKISRFPAPKIRTSRLKAQLRSRMKTFADDVTQALDQITPYFPSSSSQSRELERALLKTDDYIRTVKQSWRPSWFPSEMDRALEAQLALAENIHRFLASFQACITKDHASLERLQANIQTFRQSLLRKGSIQLLSQTHVLGDEQTRNPTSNPVDRVSLMKSVLSRQCIGTSTGDMISREHYSLCAIYWVGSTLSEIDGTAFDDAPRMWVMERKAAIDRHERRTKTDIRGLIEWQEEVLEKSQS